MVHNKNEMVYADLTTYGLSASVPKTDKRQSDWEIERLTIGFDTTEMWCLTSTIARFTLPRLIFFKNNCANWKDDSEEAIAVDQMIVAFQLVVADGIDYRDNKTKDGKMFIKGMKAFHKYYLALWC